MADEPSGLVQITWAIMGNSAGSRHKSRDHFGLSFHNSEVESMSKKRRKDLD